MRNWTDVIHWLKLWLGTLDDESGQDLAEYGLIIALIAVVAIGALTVLGNSITSVFSTIAASL